MKRQTIERYLSDSFINSEAMEFLGAKLDTHPYDYLKIIDYKDEAYTDFIQGAKINYKLGYYSNKDITVVLETNDGFKPKKITLEVRSEGNEVNIITKSPKEDSNIFHIKYYDNSKSFNVTNRVVRFYKKENEEEISFVFSKFDAEGGLLDYKESNTNTKVYNPNNNIYSKSRKRY